MKFNAVVGNPPYQEEVKDWKSETNGQARRSNIFPYFQVCADELSSGYVSLIYPGGRWIHRSGKGMSEFGLKQINDKHLAKLIYYPDANEIFKDVAIADGISIVLKDKHKNSDKFEYTYSKNRVLTTVYLPYPKDDLIPLNPSDGIIVDKVTKFALNNNLSYIHDKILSQKLFGIESSFVEENPNKVREYTNDCNIDFKTEVKLLTNDKAGKAGRAKWYITKRSNIPEGKKYIEEWQVAVSSANAGGQKRDNQITIIDNHSAFGRARVALSSFKTEQEAINFYNYCNTSLIKFMFLMTDEALTSLGKKVPDLHDYSYNNKLIDFSKDINTQLCKLIGLNNYEIDFVDKVVKSKE